MITGEIRSLESSVDLSELPQLTPDSKTGVLSGLSDPVPMHIRGVENNCVKEDLFHKPFSSHPWGTPRINLEIGDSEADDDVNSLESFALTDSPDCTTESSHTKSSKSSQSSISNGFLKSPKSSSGSSYTEGRSLRYYMGSSRRLTGSSALSFISRNSINEQNPEFKRLKSQCNKFLDINNAGKANYLRMTLLSYLRTPSTGFMPTSSEIVASTKVFKLWWERLLDIMKSNFKNINGIDKNAFYEAVSSLMARREWLILDINPSYQNLLCETMIFALTKCSSTSNLPVSHAAFTGKVLAYGFFYLPGVAQYLLSVLEIKNSVVRRIFKDQPITFSEKYISIPAYLQSLIGSMKKPIFPTKLDRKQFPWLVNDRIRGWNHHFSIDSALFASFFKHYCTLLSHFLPIGSQVIGSDFHNNEEDFNNTTVFGEDILIGSPGMILLLSAIVTNLSKTSMETRRSISPPLIDSDGLKQPHIANDNLDRKQNKYGDKRKLITDRVPPDRIRIDQLKIFSCFREVLHSEESTASYVLAFSRIFDRVFQAITLETKVYDVLGCITVCDIAEEWLSSLFSVRATKSGYMLVAYKYLVINWGFWINVIERMLSSDNIHTGIRALSFLFNIWPHLPNQEIPQPSSLCNNPRPTFNTLRYVTEWILSPNIWYKMFCHWSPLVRSYYLRLLCYRMASVGIGKESWYLDVDSAQYIAESREILKQRLAESYGWIMDLVKKTRMIPDACPSLPLPRLRVGIRRFGPVLPDGSLKTETYQTRVFPFDVFDNAAYLRSEVVDDETVNSPMKFYPQTTTTTDSSSPDSLSTSLDNMSVSNLSTDNILIENSDLQSSASSVTSQNTQESSLGNFSLDFVKKRTHRLSFTSANSTTSENSANNKNRISRSCVNTSKSPDAPKAQSNKRFSFLRKIIPIQSKPTTATVSEIPFSDIAMGNHKGFEYVHTEKKQPKKSQVIPNPPQLLQPRPEIARVPYRFVMLPTSVRPATIQSGISIPTLPFSSESFVQDVGLPAFIRNEQTDLAMWNYGGRALAEWNIEVNGFEIFAQQQRQAVNETMEMFQMPFIVAEIPWRATM